MTAHELTPDEMDCLQGGRGDAVESQHTWPVAWPISTAAGDSQAHSDVAAPDDISAPESVQRVFDELATGVAQALQQPLRCAVTASLLAVRQAAGKSFGEVLANPTCLQVFDAPLLDGQVLLELPPQLVFPMLDRLLGGGKLPPPILRRPLTDIEVQLVQRITGVFAQRLAEVWPDDINLQVEPRRVLSNAQQWCCDAPEAPLWVAKMEFAMGTARGLAHLAVPGSALV